MKRLLFIILYVLILCVSVFSEQKQHTVYLFEINGIINPVVAEYISKGLKSIPRGESVIVTLNTPGGLMDSMNSIVQSFLNTPNPIILWVGPRGAQALSAGVFITLASDIACMAPQTSIGAAHPVMMAPGFEIEKGDQESILEQKITRSASAYIRAIAEDKNRNADIANQMVTESISYTAKEALENNLIEYIFLDIDEMLEKLDGKIIKKLDSEFTIFTAESSIEYIKMSSFNKFLNIIAHPNIAYILLIVGVYGIIFELSSPGIGIGAVVGTVCLLLAFFSLQLLPVNTLGLLLLILGITIMCLDFFTPSFGVLFTAGLIPFIIGSIILFKGPPGVPSISISVIVTMAITTIGFFLFIITKAITIRKKKIVTGKEGLIGEKGIAYADFDKRGKGQVSVHGELWNAVSAEEKIKKGDEIKVTAIENMILKVTKM